MTRELSIMYPAADNEPRLTAEHGIACQAFALCDRAAVGLYRHPVLSGVLSCQRCADKLGETLEPVSVTTIER